MLSPPLPPPRPRPWNRPLPRPFSSPPSGPPRPRAATSRCGGRGVRVRHFLCSMRATRVCSTRAGWGDGRRGCLLPACQSCSRAGCRRCSARLACVAGQRQGRPRTVGQGLVMHPQLSPPPACTHTRFHRTLAPSPRTLHPPCLPAAALGTGSNPTPNPHRHQALNPPCPLPPPPRGTLPAAAGQGQRLPV